MRGVSSPGPAFRLVSETLGVKKTEPFCGQPPASHSTPVPELEGISVSV